MPSIPRDAPELIQGLAVPAFLRGIKDKTAGQEAMKFGKPKTIVEAIDQVIHIQCTARAFGKPTPPDRSSLVINHPRSSLNSLLALAVS